MTVILIVICALGTVTRISSGTEKIRGRAQSIQTTVMLRSARMLRGVLKLEETCGHSTSSGKPSANAKVKKHSKEKIIKES